jgi:surfactin synthase thioesterase subunit
VTESRWLLCRKRRAGTPHRLYCFPHSGGSPGEFLRWTDKFPDEIEVWGVQYPGRGSRREEPSHTSVARLVDAIVSGIDFEEPFSFFGHSMGALIAYQTALALRRANAAGPAHLVVSSYAAPLLHNPGVTLPLPDGQAFVEVIERVYGPLPPGLDANEDLRTAYLDNLRADLTLVGAHQPAPEEPLACSITALGGRDDTESEERLAAWRGCTTDAFRLFMFPGGHFYFRDRLDEVVRQIAAVLPTGLIERDVTESERVN